MLRLVETLGVILTLLAIGSNESQAQSNELLQLGSDAKASSGAGFATEHSGASVLYNPANIATAKRADIFVEVDMLDLQYKYTYADYNPAVVHVQTPLLFGAGAWRPTSWLTLGAAILPVPGGAGKISVTNLPLRQLSEEPSLVDVDLSSGKKFGFNSAVGVSASPRPWISLGLAFKSDLAHSATQVRDSESGQDLFANEGSLNSQAWSAGATIKKPRSFNVGAAYLSAKRSTSKGQFTNQGGQSWNYTTTTGDSIVLAGSYQRFFIAPFGQMNWYRGSKAVGSVDPLVSAAGTPIDSHDTVSFAGGVNVATVPNQGLTLSAGYYPTSVGDGRFALANSGDSPVSGVSFGNLEGISRKVVAGGYTIKGKTVKLKGVLSYQTGSREVGDLGTGPGFYEIKVFQASAGVSTTIP